MGRRHRKKGPISRGVTLNWSWNRALGITRFKNRVARRTGIPTTKAGRERKIGRLLYRPISCLLLLAVIAAIIVVVALVTH